MKFGLLGPFEVHIDGATVNLGGRQRRTLLAILAVHSGEAVSTDKLIEELWGELAPSAARKTVQAHVAHLRRIINVDGEVLLPAKDGYILQLDSSVLDSRRFEDLLERARALRQTDQAEAARLYDRALGLFRGAPLVGLADDAFSLRVEASRLEELRLSAMEERLDALIASDKATAAAIEAERLVAEHPLRERLWGSLMLSLYRSGRQAAALGAFSRLRQVLSEELGIEPSGQLQELEQRILEQDPTLREQIPAVGERRSGVRAVVRNPYKGLRAFDEADAADFFGREDLIRRLDERLRSRSVGHLTVLAGPSGAGKSSVVRAGLVPRLRDRGEGVALMLPGRDPFASLALALSEVTGESPGDLVSEVAADTEINEPMVLVVDQFEEVFTLTGDQETVDGFLDLVADASRPAHWVVTVRADFLDRLLAHPHLGARLEEALILIPPLQEHEVRQVVLGPVERVGVGVDPDLLGAVVNDVKARPSALPLLQYALTDTFERRTGDTLKLEDYRRAGGISGALTRRADEMLASLSSEHQEVAREMFLQLLTITEEGEVARRRVEQAGLLGSDPSEGMVMERFGRQRLLVFDQDPESGAATVEIAHEALINEWPRLERWVDQAGVDLRMRDRLLGSVAEWEESGRDPSFLLRGTRLAEMESWRETSSMSLASAGVELLEESRKAEDMARRRRTVRRRVITATLSFATVLSAVLAFVAFRSAEEAREQTALAEEQTRIATARQFAAGAVANLQTDPELSILLALQAVEVTLTMDGTVLKEAEEALHQAVQASRTVHTLTPRGRGAFSPDGSLVATGGPDGVARIWEVGTAQLVSTLEGHDGRVFDVDWSPDGGRLVTAGFDGTARVWNHISGDQLLTLPIEAELVLDVAFSSDGRLVAGASGDGSVYLWDSRSGEHLDSLDHQGAAVGVAFSSEGTRLAVATSERELGAVVWEVSSGTKLFRLIGHEDGLNDVAYSHDGTLIATSSADGTVRLWDAESGAQLSVLEGHTGFVSEIDFSPEDTMLVSGSEDGTAKLWDLSTGRELMTLTGHAAGVFSAGFHPSGELIVTDSDDGTVKIWDIRPEGRRDKLTVSGHAGPVTSARFSPDGTRFATASFDGSSRVWDAAGELELVLDHDDVVYDVVFSPNGTRIATASRDGTAKLWDAATGEAFHTLPQDEWVMGIAFSPDGSQLATGNAGGVVKFWDVATGAELTTSSGAHDWFAYRVAFSPDGAYVASAGWDGKVAIWGAATGNAVVNIDAHEGTVNSVDFSANGEKLVTASEDSTAKVWDLSNLDTRQIEEPLLVLDGHSGRVWAATFSPDGRRVATASFDNTVKLWDADTGLEQLTLTGATSASSASFAPDGRQILVATADGAMVYLLDIHALRDLAYDRLTRWWKPEECQTYLDSEDCPPRP